MQRERERERDWETNLLKKSLEKLIYSVREYENTVQNKLQGLKNKHTCISNLTKYMTRKILKHKLTNIKGLYSSIEKNNKKILYT